MNTLITFLNVTSVIWLIWTVTTRAYVIFKANKLKRKYGSTVKATLNDTAFALTFLSIAWLITQQMV